MNMDASQNQPQGHHNMAGNPGVSQTPTLPPPPSYTNVIYNMGLKQTLGQKLVDTEAHLHSQSKSCESVERQLQSQNSRVMNTEQQLSQMSIVKLAISNMKKGHKTR